jgi:Transposase IS66 family
LPIEERVLGAEHPETLAARQSLACWTGVAGDAAKGPRPVLLKTAPAVHADETPARAAGGTRYVHLTCTRYLTCMHTGDRSAEAIHADGVLPGYTGVIVRDGYCGYGHLTEALHAWCGARLLRDLKGQSRPNRPAMRTPSSATRSSDSVISGLPSQVCGQPRPHRHGSSRLSRQPPVSPTRLRRRR